MKIRSNGTHHVPAIRMSRRTRVSILANFAGGMTTTAVMQLLRLSDRNVTSDGEHVTDHALAAASLAGLTVSTLVHLLVPSEKEST